MTKVWISVWRSEDSHSIIGVFSTEGAANRAGESFDKKTVWGKPAGFGFTETEEWVVDGPPRESLL